jgi:predicted GH43/DUF377 family glycosyl hydrolase
LQLRVIAICVVVHYEKSLSLLILIGSNVRIDIDIEDKQGEPEFLTSWKVLSGYRVIIGRSCGMRKILLGLCILLLASVTLMPHASAAATGQEVLPPSTSTWEASFDWRPVVINTGSSFMMWYSGEANNQVDQIGLATSKDGISWSRYGQQPVLSIGASGQWDSGSVNEAWVIQDGGGYKMWYGGQTYDTQNQTLFTWEIGYATSPDGINWTKYSGNPVFTPGVSGSWDDKYVHRPIIVTTGSSYTMYYRGENSKQVAQVGIATSTDGIHWTRKGTISPIPNGTWDANWNSLYSVTATSGGYLMAYEGASTSTSLNYNIGFASSADGMNSTPYAMNPVIAPNIAGIAFDSQGVGDPMVITVGNQYYVYYDGWTAAVTGLGLAILPISQFPVPEFASPEILTAAVMLMSAALLLSRRRLNLSCL